MRNFVKTIFLGTACVLAMSAVPSMTFAATPTLTDVQPLYANSVDILVATDDATAYNLHAEKADQVISMFDTAMWHDGQVYHTLHLKDPLNVGDTVTVIAETQAGEASTPLQLTVQAVGNEQTAQPTVTSVHYDGNCLSVDGLTADGLSKVTIYKGDMEVMYGDSEWDNGMGEHTFSYMMFDERLQAGDTLTLYAEAPGKQASEPVTITIPEAQPQPQP